MHARSFSSKLWPMPVKGWSISDPKLGLVLPWNLWRGKLGPTFTLCLCASRSWPQSSPKRRFSLWYQHVCLKGFFLGCWGLHSGFVRESSALTWISTRFRRDENLKNCDFTSVELSWAQGMARSFPWRRPLPKHRARTTRTRTTSGLLVTYGALHHICSQPWAMTRLDKPPRTILETRSITNEQLQ